MHSVIEPTHFKYPKLAILVAQSKMSTWDEVAQGRPKAIGGPTRDCLGPPTPSPPTHHANCRDSRAKG